MSDYVNFGYGGDFVEINDEPSGGKQSIIIPIRDFDEFVKDYIWNRRESFVANGLVDGVIFDDVGGLEI